MSRLTAFAREHMIKSWDGAQHALVEEQLLSSCSLLLAAGLLTFEDFEYLTDFVHSAQIVLWLQSSSHLKILST